MERFEIDGIPVFFTEDSDDGLISIQFRVGEFDEPPPLRGVTHLIEHLAMFGVGRREHENNARVMGTKCEFWARGDSSELAAFAADVTRSIRSLPISRLEAELRVLRVESAGTNAGFIDRLRAVRFGIVGPGGTYSPEWALNGISEEEVEDWRRRHFTAGNMAVFVSAPELPDLKLDLDPGSAVHLPPAVALEGLAFPAYRFDIGGGVAAGFVASYGPAANLALFAVADSIEESLRFDSGMTYNVRAENEFIGIDQTHMSIGAEAVPEDYDAVVARMLEFIRSGPGEEAIERERRAAMRGWTDSRDNRRLMLNDAVRRSLTGATNDLEAWREGIASVSVGDVKEAWAAAAESMLLLIPPDAKAPGDLNELERPPRSVAGPAFKSRSSGEPNEYIIGDQGVAAEHDGTTFSIAANELALVIDLGEDEFDVVGYDETTIPINLNDIERPEEARAALHALAGGRIARPPVAGTGKQQVRRVAEEKLKRRWTVDDELEFIATALLPDEKLLNLAEATIGAKLGLLALTDRRVLWAYVGIRAEDMHTFDRDSIKSPRISGLGRDNLQVVFKGETIKFGGLRPRPRAKELLEALKD